MSPRYPVAYRAGIFKTTAKRDREMLKIAADALAIRVNIQSRLRRTRESGSRT